MASRGRPPKKDVERRPCPLEGHGRRKVVLDGLVKDKDGSATHQRFRCSMGTADEHTFRVPLAGTAASTPATPTKTVRRLSVRPYAPPEPCPEHPGGHVTRRGVYKAGTSTRQRYLCTPVGWYDGAKRSEDPEHAKHIFTPVLPRAHVEGDAACPHCAELRAIHRGDTAIARKHQADTLTVAQALGRLGRGETYAEVSVWLQELLRADGASPEPRNAWRRAADITEVFAPVVWGDWVTAINEVDAERVKAVKGVPRVVLLDDLPLFGKATKRRRQFQRFAVIAAAEAVPLSGATRTGKTKSAKAKAREVQLRLLRALPEHSEEAYTLVLDELVELFGFVPDVVVADGGKGIRPAVEALAARTGHDIVFVTSHFHVKKQLGRAIDKARKARAAFDIGSLADDIEHDRVFAGRDAWEAWWTAYERRMDAQGVPASGRPGKQKDALYGPVGAHLDALAPFPDIPRTTGALEALVVRYVKASLKRRAQGLGNLARTQQMLDLFVLHANGYFDDTPRVVAALRDDATSDPTAPGYAPPVRAMSDAGAYRSLLDPDNIDRLLDARGL